MAFKNPQDKRDYENHRNAIRRAAQLEAKGSPQAEKVKSDAQVKMEMAKLRRDLAKGYTLPPETLASIHRLMDRAAKAAAAKVNKQQAQGRGYVEIERLKAVRYG